MDRATQHRTNQQFNILDTPDTASSHRSSVITVPNTNTRAKEADETLSSDDLGSAATKTGGELVNEPDTNVEGFGTRSLCTSTVNWINVVAEVVEVGGDSVGPVVDIGRISRYQDVPSAVSASSSNVM
eukprot:scaffold13323_cov207-Alexandrium_tamarense.AAC.31